MTATLLAGGSALILALGVLFRGPIRWRNRSFAWLSLALAVWHLGYAGALLSGSTRFWQPIYLFGSFAAAPLGLDFALTLRGVTWRTRKFWVLPISACALALWGWSANLGPALSHTWPRVAFFSIVLLGSLVVILRTAMQRRPGPARRALLGVAVGGVLVTFGGVYDLLPNIEKIPGVGALATLLFLAVVCAVVLKDRLLDIDGLLLRGIAILSLVSLAAVPLWFAARQFERLHFLPFLVITLVVLTPVFLLAPRLRTRATSFLHSNDPLVKQINSLSRKLHTTSSEQDLLQKIETTARTLPPPITLQLSLTEDHRALDTLFREESFITRQWLIARIEDLEGPDKRIANEALQHLIEKRWNLVYPVRRSQSHDGCIAVGGPVPDSYLSEAMASAVGALANQIGATLERIEQLDTARRNASFIALGEVAAGLAHEIRNPLAALRGAGQAMDETSTAEQRRRMLGVIEEESSRLESFVKDFLEFAVPRPLDRQSVDLERLSKDAIAARHASGDKFAVTWEISSNSTVVAGDPEQLRRAIDNLLRNAIEQSRADLQLTVGIAQEGANHLAWSVADNGPGIEEGLLHRVRTPYFTTKSSGSGLGLAMVGSVTDRHSGVLRITNRESGGALFTMILPTESK